MPNTHILAHNQWQPEEVLITTSLAYRTLVLLLNATDTPPAPFTMKPPSHPVADQQVERGALVPEEPTESSPLLSKHHVIQKSASDEEAGAAKHSSNDEREGSSVIALLSILLIGMAP
jgi:hypothetical protein